MAEQHSEVTRLALEALDAQHPGDLMVLRMHEIEQACAALLVRRSAAGRDARRWVNSLTSHLIGPWSFYVRQVVKVGTLDHDLGDAKVSGLLEMKDALRERATRMMQEAETKSLVWQGWDEWLDERIARLGAVSAQIGAVIDSLPGGRGPESERYPWKAARLAVENEMAGLAQALERMMDLADA